MTFHVGFPDHLSEDAVQGWLSMGVVDGWTQTLDRLSPSLDKHG
jgi:hypothetical protein